MAIEITWLGRSCFRLKGREGVVITDPCPPESGYQLANLAADVVTLSRHDDPANSYLDAINEGARVLDAPGEYEVGGILVTGIATKRADAPRNVSYIYELEGIRIGHLGLPKTGTMGSAFDELKGVDILIWPVGAGGSLGAPAAADVMTTIEPRIAIPSHFKTEFETAELETLERFLKETGAKPEPQARLSTSKTGLPSDLTVIVLQPKS